VLLTGFSVVVDDLRATAATFGRLRDRASASVGGASAALGAAGGAGGDDAVLARWRDRYDPLAAALWAALGAAGGTLGSIAGKLTETGSAYLAGDHAATPSASGAPPALPGVGTAGAWGAAPPSSTGPDGVPDAVAAYYPGGDPGRLRAASAAWTALADGWTDLGLAGDSAFRSLLAANSGAAFSTMATYWQRLFVPCGTEPLLNAVPAAARTLGTSCAQLADLIDRTRAAVLGAAAEAADDMSPLQLPAELLGRRTWGLTELEWYLGTGALAVSYVQTYSDAYLRELDRIAEQLRPGDQTRLERLAAPPPATEPAGTALADVSEVLGVGLRGSAWDRLGGHGLTPDQVHLTPAAVTHILDGDGAGGGGHAPGAGVPGKSEFPQGWTRDKILADALSLARDPGSLARTRDDDGWLVQGVRDGITVRVIVDDDGAIVTAIPLKGPGVIQNRR
jgi:hypothetical protein